MAVSAEAVFDRIERFNQLMLELEPILQSLMLNDSTIIDGLAQMLATLQAMQSRSDQHIAGLAAEVRGLAKDMALLGRPDRNASAPPTKGFDRENPEVGLLAYLLPYLPSPTALDVGANVGDFAERLIDAGYEVFAFEPFSASYAALAGKALGQERLHPFNCAIGSADGAAELLLATASSEAKGWDTSLYHSLAPHPMLDDLAFGATEAVGVRSLGSLMREGKIPSDAAVLKIDTEGTDLAVIEGAGEARFSIVTAEFWDSQHPFGRAGHGDLSALVDALRARSYPWHLVIYRVDETSTLGFYCNGRSSVAKSWGNAIFFNDFSLYARAVSWCDDHLPRSA